MEPKKVNGIEVGAYLPLPHIGGYSGPCIVVGTASGFNEEYAKALDLIGDVPVFAVNAAGHFIESDFWVTVHTNTFFNRDCNAVKISDRDCEGVDVAFPIATRGGSSALLATLVALVMGFEQVVTAGVHLTGNYKSFQGRWLWYEKQLAGRVKSVSPEGTFITDHFGGVYAE